MKATSTITPMAMRAHVGSGEGVTNASMTPEMANTTTRPSATAMAHEPQVEDVLEQQIDHRDAEDTQRDTDRSEPGVVSPDQRGEVRCRELAVVVLEVGVDKLVDLGRGHQRGLELRV